MSRCLVLYCSNRVTDVCLGTCGSGLQEKKTRMCKLIELVTVEIRAVVNCADYVQSEVVWRNRKIIWLSVYLVTPISRASGGTPKLANVSIHALVVTMKIY